MHWIESSIIIINVKVILAFKTNKSEYPTSIPNFVLKNCLNGISKLHFSFSTINQNCIILTNIPNCKLRKILGNNKYFFIHN
jgi:hypothetical protein